MTRTEARNFLDDVRAGLDASAAAITAALRLTGDLPFESPVQLRTAAGAWERTTAPGLLRQAQPFDGLQA